ncbi:MAG: hypothetical protein JWM21_4561 [Acidobacteria bacterium]|nr:hypothetical protein [Acidobacteriota bacterium]
MSKLFRPSFKILVVLCFTFAVCTLAQGQATRTWVSGVGDDVNPCSRTAPCKTFAGAISKTFINGEIDCLDPGGFGTLTITKSITIDGTGTFGSTLASGTTGFIVNIAVNANDPLRTVTLRGLSINGAGSSGTVGTRTGINGINVTTNGAAALYIEDCVIFKFSQNGINVTNVPNNFNLFVRNSVIRDNGLAGISMSSSNSLNFMRGTIENSHLNGNQNGINAGANARISADNCSLSGNSNAGAMAKSLSAGVVAVVNLSNCQVSANGAHGVQAGGAGTLATSIVRLNKNHITGSGTDGINIGTSGEVDTYGNNQIFGNNIDGCPGCTPIAAPNT